MNHLVYLKTYLATSREDRLNALTEIRLIAYTSGILSFLLTYGTVLFRLAHEWPPVPTRRRQTLMQLSNLSVAISGSAIRLTCPMPYACLKIEVAK